MSFIKQIVLVVVILVVAAGGWYVLQHRDALFGSAPAATAATAAGASTPGANAARPAAGGRPTGAAPVVTSPVDVAVTADQFGAVGSLTAAQEVTLFPQVTGIVTSITFKQGTHVNAGQTLLTLDARDQQVVVDRAQVALDDAKTALDRAQRLSKTSNITQVDLQSAQITERKAEIDLEAAQLDLGKLTIKAPFDGTIGLTSLSVGDLVTSTTAIATLDDMTSLTVDFAAPERFAGRIAIGDALKASAESLPGTDLAGKVVAVDSRIDESTRTLKLQASFTNEKGALKPGMAVTVAMSFPGKPEPLVPSLSVQWDRTGSFVWKVNGDAVQRVAVTILDRTGRAVSVLADLKKDDQVVVEGVQNLRNGSKVAVVDTEVTTPAAAAVNTPASDADSLKKPGDNSQPASKDQPS